MDISKKALKHDVAVLAKKLDEFNFFKSRFEVPFRVWVKTNSEDAFRDFYIMLKNDDEFKREIAAVNRHGAQLLTTKIVYCYAKDVDEIERRKIMAFVDKVYASASGKFVTEDDVKKLSSMK